MALKDLFNWYLTNQEKLVGQYNGKVLIIQDNEVKEAFDREEDAVLEACAKYTHGTYIIQKCSTGEENYSQSFTSRVVFV